MKSPIDLPAADPSPVPKVPAWARPRGDVLRDADAAYLAGSALNTLDFLVHSGPVWAGAWRQRLALRSAASATRLIGRREEETALRDGQYFRAPGDDPGPAGKLLVAWRRLAARSTRLDEETAQAIAEYLDVKWDGFLAATIANGEDLVMASRPAPALAAEISAVLYRERPDAEILAFWLADLVLARKFRWTVPVPLLMGQAHASILKTGEGRRRLRPGEEGWGRAVLLAYAQAAAEASDLAADMAARARRLGEVEPKLRSPAAGGIVKMLLDDDAVPAAGSRNLTARSARRLFERLQDLGAVRELTGRPTFRLYGL